MSAPELQEIDAETQIFTPPYICKFLAQNSIGRVWAHSKPHSSITDKWGWWVATENPDDVVRVESPEEIRVIDPACGTGNLLVAAFDVLYDIYLDAKYKPAEIPALILSKNLVGRDIDAQAAAAASSILTAKAHAKNSHFFRYRVKPDVRALTNLDYPDTDLFGDVGDRPDVGLFGTLIRELDTSKYHVVLANPPYMGSKHFTKEMSAFAKKEYPDSARDLAMMFIQRGHEMTVPGGMISMVTPESFMFLSSYEKLRLKMYDENTIVTMAHLGRGVFGPGAVISVTAFIQTNFHTADYKSIFFRLVDSKNKARDMQQAILNYRMEKTFPPQTERKTA